MKLVDSHAHLCSDGLYHDLDNRLKAAKLLEVDYIMTIGTDSKSTELNVGVCEKYPNVCCTVGIHPHHFHDGYDVDELYEATKHPKVVGIGEVGLDYHHQDETSKPDQLTLFRDMLSLSSRCDLPYVIHSRECFDDMFRLISEHNVKSAVFHCYTDSLDNAKKILDLGYYLSFSGIITFRNADDLRGVVRYVPQDRFLVETDCPYLTPVPHRGRLNEPAFTYLVAEHVAKIKGIPIDKVSEITTNNFFNLFPKAKFLLEEGNDE